MPSMKESMNKWIGNPAVSDWVPIIKLLTNDDAVFALAMKLADDYENKRIDEMEFLASLANTTGKSLEAIEKVVVGNDVPNTTELTGESIAQQLSITYNGEQKDAADKFAYYLFTDPQTGSTFSVIDLLETNLRLTELRESFAHNKPPVKRYEYHTYLGDQLDNKLWELITRDENQALPDDSRNVPFVIMIPSKDGLSRYLPVSPTNPEWIPILKELVKQSRSETNVQS